MDKLNLLQVFFLVIMVTQQSNNNNNPVFYTNGLGNMGKQKIGESNINYDKSHNDLKKMETNIHASLYNTEEMAKDYVNKNY